MKIYREIAAFGVLALIVTVVFAVLFFSGLGLVWLIGWLVGAPG